ncbi:3-methyladenine DNA glycosylase [Neisseria shayeganii 871]|uniref:3-methyladenine DNA glycosylase n=1 Tax=Neisseria shayeganii 871 TaxID=1032488 RepID=G4CJ17_9NEIS|nr:3-methyladenine DNA glycosylase [Neisseria shayeganii 871]
MIGHTGYLNGEILSGSLLLDIENRHGLPENSSYGSDTGIRQPFNTCLNRPG